MLLEEKKVSVTSSGMKDTVDFTAKLDGLMFDNLINGIYSNKIGAGIREYSTNARDGHARRGNLDRPFAIGLPTRQNPTFEVRDYGSSLTHDEVFKIFTVLGESTKRETNDETGCLGLGSKSAFAYTNTFNVTCWLNGEERNYVCYIGEQGKPKTSLLSTVKSNEEQGMRVSYAVRAEDVVPFNGEASRQLRGFDPQPKVIRSTPEFKPLNEDLLMLEGDGWKIFSTEKSGYYGYNSGKPMAIQGSVAYPIDVENPNLKAAIRNTNAVERNKIEALLGATDCIIRFNIGEITMTTSREELQYNDHTCKNIVTKATEVIKQVETKLDEAYKNCKTLKEARILYAKTTSAQGRSDIDSILRINTRKWNGVDIQPEMCLADDANGFIGEVERASNYFSGREKLSNDKVPGEFRLEDDWHYSNKFGSYKSNFSFRDYNNSNAKVTFRKRCDEVSKTVVLLDVESQMKDLKPNPYLRRFWKEEMVGREKFLWVKVKNLADAQKFLDIMYHDDKAKQFYLHEMKPLDMPRVTSSTGSVVSKNELDRNIRVIRGTSYPMSSDGNQYKQIDFATDPQVIPCVYSKLNQFYWTQQEMEDDTNSMDYVMLSRLLYDWVGSKECVYVINNNHKKFAENNPKWIKPAKKFMIDTWKTNNPNWKDLFVAKDMSSEINENENYRRLFKKLRDDYKIVPSKLTKALNEDVKQSANTHITNFSKPSLMDNWLAKEIEIVRKANQNSKPDLRYKEFMDSDPIMSYLMDQFSYYNNSNKLINAIKKQILTQHT